MKLDYDQWFKDLITMPGKPAELLDNSRLMFLDEVHDVEGFDKLKVLEALNVEERAFDPKFAGFKEVHGYSFVEGGQMVVAINRATPYRTRVLWHELGHLLCDHPGKLTTDPEFKRELAEAEAEATAYMLCNIYHHNEPKYQARDYVQSWFKGGLSAPSKKRVVEAVNKIIKANGYRPEEVI